MCYNRSIFGLLCWDKFETPKYLCINNDLILLMEHERILQNYQGIYL